MNIKDAELVFVGSIDDNIKPVLSKYNNVENIVFKGFLKDPSDVYKESTIFVFPSLEEGSAKVTYEAMAAGLPVITTENSGSVVRSELDGFIIPMRDSEAIKEKIYYFYENPEMIEIMSTNALEHIKQYTWQKYRDNLIETYNKLPI
jgi:glycosyltransferase involved in cell wall biosynthesis